MRATIRSPHGVTISYTKDGSGPPLVLVHGAFSDDITNWEFVWPALREKFTLYAIARRGRGGTDTTSDHSVEDEVRDTIALVDSIGEPVYLLGHSYGAHCVLAAASLVPARVRKLIAYEPSRADMVSADVLRALQDLGARGAWDDMAFTFFRDVIHVPLQELEALRASELWPPIVADAPASLQDIRALTAHDFRAERFSSLPMPVLLQTGSESVRDLYATDAIAAVVPYGRVEILEGQAHEGMTTAPDQYVASVSAFLLAETPLPAA